MALGEHKTRLGELHGSLSLVWGSLNLVWADIFLTCFSLSENSSKIHFCPKINETQFCCEFVLSFLFWTDFTDNSNSSWAVSVKNKVFLVIQFFWKNVFLIFIFLNSEKICFLSGQI